MTTPYIEAKKAEFKKRLDALHPQYYADEKAWEHDLKETLYLLENFLTEIQEATVLKEWDEADRPGVEGEGWDSYRKHQLEAFQHLRTGVETEVDKNTCGPNDLAMECSDTKCKRHNQ